MISQGLPGMAAARPSRGAPQRLGSRSRPLLATALFAAALGATVLELRLFAFGDVARAQQRRLGAAAGRRLTGIQLRAYTELSPDAGLAGFQGSQYSLWITFGLFVFSLPGVLSTVQRTGQAKLVEKVYVMAGPTSGGLEMRSIAGGVFAYFKNLNYSMEEAPTKGRIRFVGNLQGSLSQALYLTCCVLGACIAVGFVVQGLFPAGPFGLGTGAWYLPCLASPYAGWYYWQRAFRKDLVELQLETNDDSTETTLTVLGDKEAVEDMQKGVRFQSSTGKLFQLMEKDMEYQPGIFDDGGRSSLIWKEKGSDKEVEAEPIAAKVA